MRSSKYLLIFFFLVVLVSQGWSTHNRAGQISYKRIQPFSAVIGGVTVPVYTYSITITKYTDDGPNIADRCVDTIFFGDGQSGLALRINGNSCAACPSVNGSTVGCGVIIINEGNYRVKENVYSIIHTYPGAGVFMIRSFDPNRNSDVHNIPNSVNLPFYIESLLVITNNMGANSSPLFTFKPIDKACLHQCFEHNPGAYDPDGDSLSFEITTSRGFNGQTVLGYFYPETGSGGSYGINGRTGELRWCTPQLNAEYNIAFIVREWRRPPQTNSNKLPEMEMIGYVLRDMQVIVETCKDLMPPIIEPIPDICIEAGKTVNEKITVRDQSLNDRIQIKGGGGAFEGLSPLATLSPTSANTTAGTPFTSNLQWFTNCDHVRQQPYIITIKAEDDGKPTKQVAFESFSIKVIPPAVKNLTAVPIGTTMKLTWTAASCNPISNPILGYLIYRKDDCTPFVADPCKVTTDVGGGFVLTGTTTAAQTSFIDNNNGDGLVVGQNYSYIVVAIYKDGAVSFASSAVCAELKRDIPVIINADVLSTSASGSVQVKWLKPLTTAGNLDLSVFKGPYKFNLKHRSRPTDSYQTIFTTTQADFNLLEESFVHADTRTDSLFHEYYLEFFSDTIKIGDSQKATTIFLKTTPGDRRIELNWVSRTPWDNYKYTIFRKKPNATAFVPINSTTVTNYVDRDSVENGSTYCYFIRSEGAYSDSSIISPLINNSQESCCTAKDMTPPGTPTVFIEANCANGFIQVTWTDIKDQSDDVGEYILYYKPSLSEEYSKVVTVNASAPLVYNSDGQASISGCYAVRAVDINDNAGELSEDFCIDNCPEFELPNVFTPNGDSINDHFKAIKVRQIKEIYLTITDRWGNLVYKTNDPYFKWDGTSIWSSQPISEGTFFYVCDVFEPRLKGITKRTFKGTVHCLR